MVSRDSVLMHTFCGEGMAGSPQWLHFFETRKELARAFESFSVEDETDHSFVYRSTAESCYVKWRNRAGPVQLCGSGAYALSWALLRSGELDRVEITGDVELLSAFRQDQAIFLEIPSAPVIRVEKSPNDRLFLHRGTGIYFLGLGEKKRLYEEDWLNRFLPAAGLPEIHGFCVFHWDVNSASGSLRYFTPWHGRDEDHVTGSVQRYLTPLVHGLHGAARQTWTQASSRGGRLASFYEAGKVFLSGTCEFAARGPD